MNGWKCVALPLAALTLIPLARASAQDSGDVQDLRREVQELRKEVQDLSKDMKVLLAEIKKRPAAAAPSRAQADTKIYDVDIKGSPMLGAKDGAVTIVEFSEFQCPFCVREDPKIKQVLKEYPNDVKLVFKHFPLGFHKKAKPAAAATVLARQEQGDDGFWKMHDMIMAGGAKKLEVTDLRGYAEQMGLDLTAFDALMTNEAAQDKLLEADMEEAKKCGVRGTPTILINGLKLADRSIEGYKARVDAILKEKKKS